MTANDIRLRKFIVTSVHVNWNISSPIHRVFVKVARLTVNYWHDIDPIWSLHQIDIKYLCIVLVLDWLRHENREEWVLDSRQNLRFKYCARLYENGVSDRHQIYSHTHTRTRTHRDPTHKQIYLACIQQRQRSPRYRKIFYIGFTVSRSVLETRRYQ